MVAEFRKRRDRVMDLIKSMPGMRCPEPPGAFYVFPDISHWFGRKSPEGQQIQNADDLSMYLLHAGHVTVVTGTAFGEPNCIRISFANSVENIEKGFARIKKALEALS
jgi:aspartate aminotransferase